MLRDDGVSTIEYVEQLTYLLQRHEDGLGYDTISDGEDHAGVGGVVLLVDKGAGSAAVDDVVSCVRESPEPVVER